MSHSCKSSRESSRQARTDGFTLLELLVILAVIGLVATTLLPALARDSTDVQKMSCLNGKRQLCMAWRFYADDNNGSLVPNWQGGVAVGGSGGAISWATGWLDWTLRSDNTNAEFIISPRYARLAPYVQQQSAWFKCPTDKYLSPVQRAAGWQQRVRSVSASVGVGEGNAEAGPWDQIYKHARKLTDLIYPSPAETYVFLDEHPDSMNEGAFFNPHATAWIDLPAVYHFGGAGFAFTDCHAEIHKWAGSLANVRSYYGTFPAITGPAGDPDLHWMSYHASRVSTNSY